MKNLGVVAYFSFIESRERIHRLFNAEDLEEDSVHTFTSSDQSDDDLVVKTEEVREL